MSEKIILAVDAGTGDCRVIAFAADGTVRMTTKHEWIYEKTENNAFTFDAAACWKEILEMLQETASQLHDAEILAVTVTSQRDGMVFLDSQDREVYCAPNMDLRGGEVLSELEPFRAEILAATGLPLHAMFGLPRLVYYRRNHPELYEKICTVFMLCDWIAWRLTGEKRSERAAASSSQMLNLTTGEYDMSLMEHLGLKTDCFVPCISGTEAVGTLKAEVAAALNTDRDIPVFIGGSDTHSGAVGMNVLQNGELGVIAGTTTPVISLMAEPKIDAQAHVYCSCSALPRQWALESCADSTGLSLRWVRDLFLGSVGSFTAMEKEAALVAPGCDGMSAYIGVGIRDENRGCNWGGFCFPVPWNVSDYHRGHFFRAALETNAFGVMANMEVLQRKGIVLPEKIHVCGGQSQSPLWNQMLSDITQRAVQSYRNTECTALGAAAMAACGMGEYASLEESVSVFAREDTCYLPDRNSGYPELYRQWLELHRYLINYQN